MPENEKPEAQTQDLVHQAAEAKQQLESLSAHRKELERDIEQERQRITALEHEIEAQRQKKAGLHHAIESAGPELADQERQLGAAYWQLQVARRAAAELRSEAAALAAEMQQHSDLKASVVAAREKVASLQQSLRDQARSNQDLEKAIRLEMERAAELGKQLAEQTLTNHGGVQRGQPGRARTAPPAAGPAAAATGTYILDGNIMGPDGEPAAHDRYRVLSAASGKYLASGTTDASGHIHTTVPERSVIVEVDGIRYPQEAESAETPKVAAAVA